MIKLQRKKKSSFSPALCHKHEQNIPFSSSCCCIRGSEIIWEANIYCETKSICPVFGWSSLWARICYYFSPKKPLLICYTKFFLWNLVMLLYKPSHLRTEKKKSLLFALQALYFRLKCALSKKLQMGSWREILSLAAQREASAATVKILHWSSPILPKCLLQTLNQRTSHRIEQEALLSQWVSSSWHLSFAIWR